MTLVAMDALSRPSDAEASTRNRNGGAPPMEVRFEHSLNLPHSQTSRVLPAGFHLPGRQAGRGWREPGGVRALPSTTSSGPWESRSSRTVSPWGRPPRSGSCTRPPELPADEPIGRHDGCFLARSSHFTGDIQIHEMAWSENQLWIVNTAFSCLCTLDDHHSFVPRWRPPFITGLAAEDRCHLNGLAMADGRPKYVTALAETDTPQGWRPAKATSGCLIDVASGVTVARGFAMPHSPRVHQGRVYLLDSGMGRFVTVDPPTGSVETVAELPGYSRGLAMQDRFAFMGLSKIRETATFGGVPVAERRDELKCGVAVVDLATGRHMAFLEFQSGVDEIFDVQLLPGILFPALSGPNPVRDGGARSGLLRTPARRSGYSHLVRREARVRRLSMRPDSRECVLDQTSEPVARRNIPCTPR